jgi:tetratricopeptide (TPR) repeat protein
MLRNRLSIFAVFVLLAGTVAVGQTFEINGESGKASSNAPKKSARPTARRGSASTDTGMGWGSSIEVARQARAAQEALRRNDYSSAVNFAQRATKAAPQNPDFWFLLAYSARLAGRYQMSLDAYNKGLSLRPSSIEGLSGLAQTYAKMGRGDQAKQLVEKVLAANPRSVDDLRLAGELFLFNDPKQALTFFQRADAIQSTARTELSMARAYQRLGDTAQSHQMLERARAKAPKDPEVLRAVAAAYRDNGQYDQAIAILKSVPMKSGDALAELAYTYQVAGDRKDAADTYIRAANAAPGDIEIQLNAAQALVNAGEFPKADGLLNHAASLNPNHYRMHAIRGQMDGLNNHDDQAIKEYQTAIADLPAEGVPEGPLYPISLHVNLYQLYRDTGDTAAAAREASTARSMIQPMNVQDQSRPEFLRLRAAIAVAFNDTASAEKDLKEAMSLQPNSTNLVLNYANLLWKTNRRQESLKMYQHALQIEPNQPAALSALGYLSREMGDNKAAEAYFNKLAQTHPDDYVPYLALGDMYTARREFKQAQASYERAHQLNPGNALVFAGGINSALEGHTLPVAKGWIDRANQNILTNPQVMREHERYLTMTGKYQESAQLGYQVIQKLPRDPEAPVYLAYDLLFLNKYDEAMAIVRKFAPILPKDKDLPLIAGYVHTHYGQYQEALQDFTRALQRDPKMATGYMNRGYVENDLRLASRAEKDFREAIKLKPDYGEAHLGLAYSYLQLRSAKAALRETDLAEKYMGDSRPLHLARAEGYRQQVLLAKAENEYKAALKYQPDDVPTYLALSDAQYRQRHYDASIETLNTALKYTQNNPMVYADIARADARLGRNQDAVREIQLAEKTGGNNAKILLATADAFLIMNNRNAAMERYAQALDLSDADRLQTRISLARLFVEEGNWPEARNQIAMGFAEARVSDASVITAEDYLDAADVLMATQDFKTAEQFYGRAQAAGADELAVAVGMANAHLALGETKDAQTLLASVHDDEAKAQSYAYQVSMANVYRQRQDTFHALSGFARAASLAPDDTAAQQAVFQLADEQGKQITPDLSVASQLSVDPIFEDENIYQMDARLRLAPGAPASFLNSPAFLRPPRRSVQTFADARYKYRLGSFPVISGFVGERNARGTVSFPSQLLIQRRNTYDTIFNGAVSPVLHLGNVNFTLMPGLQYTIRRDTLAPVNMNQDLFRQFVYLSSSPIFNWLSFSGDLIREAGPFTQQKLHSRDFSGAVNFRVGRPWGKTAFITGYAARDLLFRPSIHEYYGTDSYAGLERKFGTKVTASAVADYLRAWRVEGTSWAIGQTLRPAFSLDIRPNERWTISTSGYWSQGKGFHVYDNYSNGILISYMKPLRGAINDGTGAVDVSYPLRFSIGLQQQTFYDFPGHARTQIVPIVRLTLF